MTALIYHLAIAIGVLAALAVGWGLLQRAVGGRDAPSCPACPGCLGGCRRQPGEHPTDAEECRR